MNAHLIKLKIVQVRIIIFVYLMLGSLFAFSQTLVGTEINTPIAPGDYYNNQSITLSPGFTALPTGNYGFHFYINPNLKPGPCTQVAPLFSQDKNYVVTTVTKVSGITDATQLAGKGTCEIMQTVQYIDGFGRPIQTIALKASPGFNDVIQAIDYDVLNRQSTQYLSYTVTGNGEYKSDALQPGLGLSLFYSNPPAGITQNSFPIAQSGYDGSPLNRIIEQSSPGGTWQLGNHTAKVSYAHNDNIAFNSGNSIGCKKVALYTAKTNSDGTTTLSRLNGTKIYDNDQLSVRTYKDENWISGCLGTSEKYTDKEGHTVLLRTYNRASNGQIEILSTYNVYDQFGNLCFVLPPKSEPDDDNSISQDILNNLCYQYNYDKFNRVIRKKHPVKVGI